jgi:DedD protein
MRDPQRMKEGVDLRLDNRQIVSFVIGALVVLGVVFALGVLVGKQLAVSSMPAASPGDPLALIDAKEKIRAGADSVTGTAEPSPAKPDNLTFAAELTKTPKPGTSPVEPTRSAEPAAAKASEGSRNNREAKTAEKHGEKSAEKHGDKSAEKPSERPAEKPSAKGDEPKRTEGLAAAFDKAATRAGGDGQYCLQVASLPSREEAEKLSSKLAAKGFAARVIEADPAGKGHVYRIRVGSYATREEAEAAVKAFKKKSNLQAIITSAR